MNVSWTEEANILSIFLGGEVEQTVEVQPGLFLDLDKEGRIVGLETHDAAHFLEAAKCSEGVTVASPKRIAAKT